MSSYSQQTINNGQFPNGMPPQMAQQAQQIPPQPPQQMMPNSGMNKFFPPASQSIQPPQQYQPNPNALKSNFMPPPTSNPTQPLKQVGLPVNPMQQKSLQLTNGDNSAHSSRTASPALNNTINTAVNNAHLPPGRVPMSSAPNPTRMAQASPVNTAMYRNNFTGSNQNVSNLSGSMQNLSLGPQNNMNGPAKPPLNSGNLLPNQPQTNFNQNQFAPQYPTSPPVQPNMFSPRSTTGSLLNNAVPPPNAPMGRPPMPTNPPYTNTVNAVQKMDQKENLTPSIQSTNQHMLNNNPPVAPNLQPQQTNMPPFPQQQKPQYPPFAPHPQQLQQQPPQQQPQLQQPMPPSQPLQPPQLQQTHAFQQQQQQQQQMTAQVPQANRKPMYPNQQITANLQQQPYMQQPQQQQNYQPTFNGVPANGPGKYQQLSATQHGFNKLWGQNTLDLMQHRHILPREKVQAPPIALNHQLHEAANCSPDIFRCTLNKIPESNNLLQKSRLPLGILIHPFRDLNNLPVIQCATIVRCRLCRTYINPFVYFVDSKKWKCNLCYRVNELPEEFQYDPVSKSYGDVTRRPEVKSSTIEFIAPSEYMLRPPQPAIYLFLLDVSILAQQSGYLEVVCNTLSEHLDNLPGDARTRVGFIAYNSAIHFYNIAEGYNQPHEITIVDIEDAFLPCPDNLLINLHECKELIKDLLNQLPTRFANSHDPESALGAALQVAYKLMSASGGRVTVFQTCLPNKGPGALTQREDPNNRSSREVLHLGPATDFYKRHALECSSQQIAVDVFLLNQQYSDLATLSGVSKYSAGCIHHFPLYHKSKPHLVDSFKRCLERYLTRKIGFESVMRVRCTRGLQIHTFHGNFFVRSTDLLSLPNVNPDAGYGMQISYEDSLRDAKTICFQAALLYTSSKGERRIRVHTLCLPVTTSLSEVIHSADVQCIIGLLSKMAVDRSLTSSVSDARDAFVNACVDVLSAYKIAENMPQGQSGQLMTPQSLSLFPLYILALLKHVAFRVGTSTRLDDRVYAMDCMKTLPLDQLMKYIYPEFYQIDCLFYNAANANNKGDEKQDPPQLQLTAEYIDSRSMFLLDCGTLILIYVGLNVPPNILQNVLGVQTTAEIPDYCYDFPTLNTPESEALQTFIDSLNEDKPYVPTIQIIRDTSTCRSLFTEKLIDDRGESSLSYYEFLQHLRTQVK